MEKAEICGIEKKSPQKNLPFSMSSDDVWDKSSVIPTPADFFLYFSFFEQGKRRNKYIHVNAVQNFTDLTYKTFTKVSLLFNISLSLLFSHAATIPKV